MASKYPSPPASPHSPNNLDDLLTCPVCLDSFKEPKTLSCLHSFCTCCLESCRRPYRRDISCPVCKKVTPLSPLGIAGLQNDFRIQQIRDILINRSQSPTTVSSDDESPCSDTSKFCDLCKSEQKSTAAKTHCIQCFMYFCASCTTKHNQNGLFASHHVFNMGESKKAAEVLFCRTHKEHPVRYFCKPCSAMMCTICTMNHNASHAPEPLEKGIIEKYRKELTHSLRTVKSKLSEVKSQAKYLETIKETHQQAQYEAQNAIKEKTEELVQQIRDQEQKLLQEVQQKIEMRMKDHGLDVLGEIRFHKNNMEQLYSEIHKVVKGSPQECLVAYEDLISKLKTVSDASLPPIQKNKSNSVVRFVPATDDLRILIGTLQEVNIHDDPLDAEMVTVDNSSLSSSPNVTYNNPFTAGSPNSKTQPRRTSSILSALSPNRKGDVKIGKVKAYSANGERPKSPSRKINADELLASTSTEASSPCDAGEPSTSLTMPASPTSPNADEPMTTLLSRPMQLFKVDQIGGWPGKITSPSSVSFLPTGSIIVAECENRLQVFDTNGKSGKIIGWGKVKPRSVTVLADGRIAISDQKDNSVKVFTAEGECFLAWGAGHFGSPSGIAALSNGNMVVTDDERHSVSIHGPDGALITTFGSWGNGDYQFNSPAYVTVDKDDNILVSDTANSCIKIFDKAGVYQRKFTLLSGKQSNQIRRPQGLVVDSSGRIIIADRDSHRITMFSNDGRFIRHLLSKNDGIRYPLDVDVMGDMIAVVESHSGFLSKDPHHAVKLYKLTE